MSAPIKLVLSRLEPHRLRPTGRDRWRACCPAHQGTNASTLSVGVADDGAVLLHCWAGCDVEQIVAALGLDLGDLFPAQSAPGHGASLPRRRRMVTAGQALDLLSAEIVLTVICANDLARGDTLDAAMRQRLLQAAARVELLRDEVHA